MILQHNPIFFQHPMLVFDIVNKGTTPFLLICTVYVPYIYTWQNSTHMDLSSSSFLSLSILLVQLVFHIGQMSIKYCKFDDILWAKNLKIDKEKASENQIWDYTRGDVVQFKLIIPCIRQTPNFLDVITFSKKGYLMRKITMSMYT